MRPIEPREVESMVERPKDDKGVECALCAPFEQSGTWRCAECGAMNINKWTECWKCKSPRFAAAPPPSAEGAGR